MGGGSYCTSEDGLVTARRLFTFHSSIYLPWAILSIVFVLCGCRLDWYCDAMLYNWWQRRNDATKNGIMLEIWREYLIFFLFCSCLIYPAAFIRFCWGYYFSPSRRRSFLVGRWLKHILRTTEKKIKYCRMFQQQQETPKTRRMRGIVMLQDGRWLKHIKDHKEKIKYCLMLQQQQKMYIKAKGGEEK